MSEHTPSEHADGQHDLGPAALDADEPRTPYWLTGLGGALFLAVAVFLLATAGEDDPAAGGAAANGAPAAEQNPAEPPSEE